MKKYLLKTIWFLSFFLWLYSSMVWSSGPIKFSNMQASQKGNWIEVTYDMENPGDGDVWVNLEIALDGESYTLISQLRERLEGDFGIVEAGTNKKIRWQATVSLAGQVNSQAKIRVTGDYLSVLKYQNEGKSPPY